jgi:nicotinamide-nucleotide amidase
MQVEIINIGDELLIGQVINSNAARMGKALLDGGFTTRRMITISDNREDILSSIDQRLPGTQVLIFSGGLGPTRDDLTKNVLAEYFDTELVFNQDAYDAIVKIFSKRNLTITETNKEQAYLPKDCISLPNPVGTARGLWFEKDDLVLISLPGVPFELDALMETEVMPRLIEHYKTQPLYNKTIMTIGIGESFLSDLIQEWELALPQDISLAYLPQYGSVRLRLSCSNTHPKASLQLIDEQIAQLKPLISEYIYGYDEITLQEVVGALLIKKQATLATAESCTGGYISHLITSISGSSAYFKGSITAYANTVKVGQLGVNAQDIEDNGAVSEIVVTQMAEGARKNLTTDYAIATSGIAGPDGGTEEKPVGTIWIAVATPKGTIAEKFQLGDHRGRNIVRSATLGLNMLRKVM